MAGKSAVVFLFFHLYLPRHMCTSCWMETQAGRPACSWIENSVERLETQESARLCLSLTCILMQTKNYLRQPWKAVVLKAQRSLDSPIPQHPTWVASESSSRNPEACLHQDPWAYTAHRILSSRHNWAITLKPLPPEFLSLHAKALYCTNPKPLLQP